MMNKTTPMPDVFDSDNTPFDFPCQVPIKAMGRDEPAFPERILAIVQEHIASANAADLSARSSSNGKFVSVTIKVTAESREQLEAIYQQLHAAEDVLWTL